MSKNRQLARIIKDCGHRGKVGHIYEVIEKNPRDGFRLVYPGKTQFTFWYPEDCVEEVELGACNLPNFGSDDDIDSRSSTYDWKLQPEVSTWKVPENADFAWHLDKVAKSVTDLLKEKNAAYGNSALNPANIFSKLDAVESLLVRMDDKIMRIKNRGITDQTEDTVSDLIGYLFLLKMALERKWGK